MERIKLFNEDNLEVMKRLPDESIDVICIDPPYLYLKNQKLERPFDEHKFFSECRRLLTKNGFIVMFGRGESFYRWNTILSDLKFNFKEEIVWNKRRVSSPVSAIGRVHETISIFCKGSGKINNVKVCYGEMKAFDQDKVYEDIKRLKGLFNRGRAYDKVVENLKKADANIDYSHGKLENNYKTTQQTDQPLRCISTYTLLALENGVREQTIISDNGGHYSNIHPTQKPVRLLERLLALVIPETKPREEIVIADFFGGSMSCMEAVHNMGMQGIACEIDQEYFELGKTRIEKLQPLQPELFR
ncbi:site-specific DNA-methyltransferase (adenine-specific) [Chryseobacterium oranimense]|uniref:Methyltransferase n=2 Tax=Chryseobacterium oranimense TaxID=421058 RepID=A0A1M5XCB8_9FLAO|nr:site-specific DNA-methyltransferase (adenine-specific) [Chryseobacterium oranimense]